MDNNVCKAVEHARERMRLANVALDQFEDSRYHDTDSLYEALEALEDSDGCLQEDIHDALRLLTEADLNEPECVLNSANIPDTEEIRRLNDMM